MDLIYLISGFICLIIFIVTLVNLFTAPELMKAQTEENQLVSILIPARNEEKNIEDVVIDCLNQTYSNKEIIVLNDHSTDNTKKILEQFSDKIQIIEGLDLPDDWLGKNWACHQLSQKASGEYLLFVDADVRLDDYALESSIAILNKTKSKMLSVFPTQIMKSFSEFLIVPLMNWLLLSFLPLVLVYKSKNKSFVAANGQFILWDKNFYNSIGGHQAVKNMPVEDMEFARIVKSSNQRMITLLGGKMVFCRMYSNLNEALNGFAKNFYPGFKINPIVFISFISLIVASLLIPFFYWKDATISIVLIAVILLSRVFISIKSRQNIFYNLILHIFQMIFVIAEAVISVYRFHSKKLVWKGRKI
ncbi:MAG: glycosyltransferase family 2 protein [Ignavibacterium sp.]|nr:glycosyltransferase family 2 protein [Ignavibacterium sp.]